MSTASHRKPEDYPPPVLVIGEERFVGQNLPDMEGILEQESLMKTAPHTKDSAFPMYCVEMVTKLLVRMGFSPFEIGGALHRGGVSQEEFFDQCQQLLQDQLAIHRGDHSPALSVYRDKLLSRKAD